MAAGLARKMFSNPRARSYSAGVDAAIGCRPSAKAVKAMEEVGVDITRDHAKHVCSLDLIQYDIIVAMTQFVATLLTKDFYIPKGRLVIWDITDPFGGSLEEYRSCRTTIYRHMRALGRELALSQNTQKAR